MRVFSKSDFDGAFSEVENFEWQETKAYYTRYKSRYEAIIKQYCALSPSEPQRVLEIGGGQMAFMLKRLWSDSTTVADVADVCFSFLKKNDIECFLWNLARDESSNNQEFDFIICSEVIEHIPIPGHIVLERLKARLRPGGCLILTTPNLYRLRNVVFLALGRRIFDVFQYKESGGSGHIVEYSKDHLLWQYQEAKYKDIKISIDDFHHVPNRVGDRIMSFIGKPLTLLVPRFKDNLIAVAYR
jgi:2-polyprenyl-3-methyl-5-hydroxy-6-metoxy-1,4-benzoquinol methylase